MAITLIDLPYPLDALAPAISAETLKKHHGAHHKGYVDKVNSLTKDTNRADASLEQIIVAARNAKDAKLFNQAAQVWNHGFYWHSLAPESAAPPPVLAQAIEESFGGMDAFSEQLAKAAIEHFGSGWAWLVASEDTLSIESTHDADTFADGQANPLLVIDIWEHAYYLDRQNERKAYVDAVVGKLLNWEFAADNLARGTNWTYPD